MGFNNAINKINGAIEHSGRSKGAGFALLNQNPLGVARAIVAEMHPALGFIDDVAGVFEGAKDAITSSSAGQKAISAVEGIQSAVAAGGLMNPGLGPIAATATPGIMAAREIERVKKEHPEYRQQDINAYRAAFGK